MTRAAALAAAVLLLTACAASQVTETSQGPLSAPSEAQTPTPAPTEDREPSVAEPCDERQLDGIDKTIRGQLRTFARADFAAALEFASEAFRSSIDADDFERLIADSYPELLATAEHVSGPCVADGDRAQLVVRVSGEAGERDLVYAMVFEQGDWRVDGAAPHSPTDGTTETV